MKNIIFIFLQIPFILCYSQDTKWLTYISNDNLLYNEKDFFVNFNITIKNNTSDTLYIPYTSSPDIYFNKDSSSIFILLKDLTTQDNYVYGNDLIDYFNAKYGNYVLEFPFHRYSFCLFCILPSSEKNIHFTSGLSFASKKWKNKNFKYHKYFLIGSHILIFNKKDCLFYLNNGNWLKYIDIAKANNTMKILSITYKVTKYSMKKLQFELY